MVLKLRFDYSACIEQAIAPGQRTARAALHVFRDSEYKGSFHRLPLHMTRFNQHEGLGDHIRRDVTFDKELIVTASWSPEVASAQAHLDPAWPLE